MLKQICLNSEKRVIDWTFFEHNRFCHAFKPDSEKCLCGLKINYKKMLNPVPYNTIKDDIDYINSDRCPERQGDVAGYVISWFCSICWEKAKKEDLLPDFLKNIN